MAELRQFAHSGKEIDETVDKVENGTVYEAGEGITIDGNTISAQSLEAGDSIEIANGVINYAPPEIPTGSSVAEQYWGYLGKGLPFFHNGAFYVLFDVRNNRYYTYYCHSDTTITTANYKLKQAQYDNLMHTISFTNNNYIVKASATTYGLVRLGNDTVVVDTINSPSTDVGKTYPVQVDSNGNACVNVPWEGGSLHSYEISFVIQGVSYEKYLRILLTTSETIVSQDDLAAYLYNKGFISTKLGYPASGWNGNTNDLTYYWGVYSTGTSYTNIRFYGRRFEGSTPQNFESTVIGDYAFTIKEL